MCISFLQCRRKMDALQILEGLQKQRERGFLCDVSLQAEGIILVVLFLASLAMLSCLCILLLANLPLDNIVTSATHKFSRLQKYQQKSSSNRCYQVHSSCIHIFQFIIKSMQ